MTISQYHTLYVKCDNAPFNCIGKPAYSDAASASYHENSFEECKALAMQEGWVFTQDGNNCYCSECKCKQV